MKWFLYVAVIGLCWACNEANTEGGLDSVMASGGSPTGGASGSAGGQMPGDPGRPDVGNQGSEDAFSGTLADRYIPPLERDVGVFTPGDELRTCVEQMTTFLSNTARGFGCDDYTKEEQADRSSPYNLERQVAACIELTCEGTPLESHNGIPALRTCAEMADLVVVLERARDEAIEGGCQVPLFQLRVIQTADFMGGEPCDQMGCGIDDEGDPVMVDNRDNF